MKGIYLIEIGEDKYVGSASKIIKRWQAHCGLLYKGLHHCKKLQNSYNSLGIESLKFSVLQIYSKSISQEDLWKEEVKWSLKMGEFVNRLPIEDKENHKKNTKEEVIKRLKSHNKYKPFYSVSSNNEILETHDFNYEAAKKYKIGQNSLRRCLKDRVFNDIGIGFIYVEDYNNNLRVGEPKEYKRKLKMFTIYGDFVKNYDSIADCARDNNCDISNVRKKINNPHKKIRIEEEISKYLITEGDIVTYPGKDYWSNIFKELQAEKGSIKIIDCFNKEIASTTIENAARVLNRSKSIINTCAKKKNRINTFKIKY